MKLPVLVSRRVRPRRNQRESPLKSAKATVMATESIPQGPRPPKKAKMKAEKATALPRRMVEK